MKIPYPFPGFLDKSADKGYLAQALLRSGKHKEALAVYESCIEDMNERGFLELSKFDLTMPVIILPMKKSIFIANDRK